MDIVEGTNKGETLVCHFAKVLRETWGGVVKDVFVAGVGMTLFGPQPDRSIKDLVREAVTEAFSDAGASKESVEAAFFANVAQGFLEGQVTIPGEIALRAMGIGGIPVVNVENACASGATAFHLAVAYLRSGMADVVLAIGAEKLCLEDKEKVVALFEGGWDVQTPEENVRNLLSLAQEESLAQVEGRRTVFMDIYAALARGHMRNYGTTQRQIAAVAAKNHWHSQFNAKSHYRKPMSVEEVLAGRALAYPLTVPMCSPLSDGAAAAILVTSEGLRRLSGARHVRVLASVLATGRDRSVHEWDRHVVRRAAASAYKQASIGPGDISVAEVHDATAVGEIVQVELLGFCERGQGGVFGESGASRLGGKIPINTSGGLECKGHPLAATGLGQIYELVLQLRGEATGRQVENARFALAENGGGIIGFEEAAACMTILGRAS